MSNSQPFVAIVGGLWDLQPSSVDEARLFAHELGVALAEANLGLVVYYSNEQSLEPHVVSGYASVIPPGSGAGSIRVRFAHSQRDDVIFSEQADRGELFERTLFAGDDWEAPFYRSLAEAQGVDAVLLLAGSRSTLIAGQIALARDLPTLAIDRFGGAAKIIWHELANRSKDYPSSSTHEATDLVDWLKARCTEQAEAQQRIDESHERLARLTSQNRKSGWMALSFGALLVTLFFGMGQTPAPTLYPALTFIGLIAAGATGALIQAMIWKSGQSPPSTSFMLGGVAGFVVGLAYLIPQWVGAPGVLEASAVSVEATDKIQFVSAVLVAFSAGIGFDTVFSRLRKEAKSHAVGPLL